MKTIRDLFTEVCTKSRDPNEPELLHISSIHYVKALFGQDSPSIRSLFWPMVWLRGHKMKLIGGWSKTDKPMSIFMPCLFTYSKRRGTSDSGAKCGPPHLSVWPLGLFPGYPLPQPRPLLTDHTLLQPCFPPSSHFPI